MSKVVIYLRAPEELAERITSYAVKHNLRSRNKAALVLLDNALNSTESQVAKNAESSTAVHN